MHNDEVFELRNVDPEDVADVLVIAEKSFGFKFGVEGLKNVKTFGEVCDIIVGKVEGEHKDDCTSQQAFYKLRDAIAKATLINSKIIEPNTSLLKLFPRQNRRKNIKNIERRLGFRLHLLRPKYWISITLFLILLAAIVYVFIDWKIGLAGILLFVAGIFLANKTGNEIDSQDMRSLAKKIVRENYRQARRNPLTINRKEIAEQVKFLFAENLNLEQSVLHRNATFD